MCTADQNSRTNILQQTRNEEAFFRELVKNLLSSPNEKSLAQKLERSVKPNRRVDIDTAETFKKQGNLDVLELMGSNTLHNANIAAASRYDPLLVRKPASQPSPRVQTRKPTEPLTNCHQETFAREGSILENGRISSEKGRRHSQITRSTHSRPTLKTKHRRGSRTEGRNICTQGEPTDGTETPSFIRAWNKKVTRRQPGKVGQDGKTVEAGKMNVTTKTSTTTRRYLPHKIELNGRVHT